MTITGGRIASTNWGIFKQVDAPEKEIFLESDFYANFHDDNSALGLERPVETTAKTWQELTDKEKEALIDHIVQEWCRQANYSNPVKEYNVWSAISPNGNIETLVHIQHEFKKAFVEAPNAVISC